MKTTKQAEDLGRLGTKNLIVLLIENFHARNFEQVEMFALNQLSFLFKIKGRYNLQSADKSLARPGRKQTTATEDFEFHISYL